MRSISILMLLLLAVPALADDWIFTAEEATFAVEASESASVVRFSDDSRITLVQSRLDFFPRSDYRQTVKELITFPESSRIGHSLVYEWENPSAEDLTFSLLSTVSTRNFRVPVTKRVDFPLLYIEPNLLQYTEPTLSTDSDTPEIRKLASELATGEDDLYEVVFKIADWITKNIEYKTVSETLDFAQKASWVLQRRIGVCDEQTTLFVALLRSIDIPAKYVSGLAYSADERVWGPHAWAEVYFPDFGWVPFDVTYGEFGYLDVSHIKLRESVDADVPSSRYEWKGYKVDLRTSQLALNTTIMDASGTVQPLLSVSLQPFARKMGFGSYNYVEAKLVNNNPFYVTENLFLAAPPELKLAEPYKNVLLHPSEHKSVYWMVHLDQNLQPEYVYTLPATLYFQNFSARAVVLGASDFPSHPKASIQEMITPTGKTKTPTNRISLQCVPKYPEFYPDETDEIDCWVRNSGNSPQEVRVCHDNDCRPMSLGVAQKKKTTFALPHKTTFYFTATGKRASANDTVKVKGLEKPAVSIGDIEYPKTVAFGDDYFISFVINKESIDDPRQVLVLVHTDESTKNWDFDVLNDTQSLTVEMTGRSLRDGENSVKILVSYYDRHQRRYEAEAGLLILLRDVTMGQRALMWYDHIKEHIGKYV